MYRVHTLDPDGLLGLLPHSVHNARMASQGTQMRLGGAHKLATAPGHHYFGSVTDEGDSLACHGSRIPNTYVTLIIASQLSLVVPGPGGILDSPGRDALTPKKQTRNQMTCA